MSDTHRTALTRALKDRARAEGFEAVGAAPLVASDHGAFYRWWLERGHNGAMDYLARDDAVAARLDPAGRWPELPSVLVVAHHYFPGDPEDPASHGDEAKPPDRGIIARYARGRDYHGVIRKKLLRLVRWLEEETGRALPVARAYVDTGPVLERELAQRAGLGWQGRNTVLIDPRRGSWFFLGVLLLPFELEYDAPFEADRCGSCRACLDACPTGALLGRNEDGAPVIDARRCISYLTIENRGAIPVELRAAVGNRIYGCDVCQEVCPWNSPKLVRSTAEADYLARGGVRSPAATPLRGDSLASGAGAPSATPLGGESLPARRSAARGTPLRGDSKRSASGLAPPLRGDSGTSVPGRAGSPGSSSLPGTSVPRLVELMRMTREEWDRWTRGSAIRRAGYAGLKRNVAVAIGNWLATVQEVPEEVVAALRDAVGNEDPLVSGHAQWALRRAHGS